MVNALMQVIAGILLLRRGPQDLPAVPVLFWLLMLGSGLTSVLVASQTSGFIWGVQQAGFGLLCLSGFVWGLLALNKKRARFMQTFSALCGTDMVLNLLSLPLVYIAIHAGPEASQLLRELAMLTGVLLYGLLLWSLLVMGHVLRHALMMKLPVGLLLAFAYFVVMQTLLFWVFPLSQVRS